MPQPGDLLQLKGSAGRHRMDEGIQLTVTDNLYKASGWETGAAEILAVKLEKLAGDTTGQFHDGEQVCMTLIAKAHQDIDRLILGFLVRDRLGQDLFGENTLPVTDKTPKPIKSGQKFKGSFIFSLPMLPNGQYSVMALVADGDLYDHVQHHWLHDALFITVSSKKHRYGLVGILFQKISLELIL